MLFILFDIDGSSHTMGSYPSRLNHNGIPILGPMLFFTFVLVVGLIANLKAVPLSGKNSSSASVLKPSAFLCFRVINED